MQRFEDADKINAPFAKRRVAELAGLSRSPAGVFSGGSRRYGRYPAARRSRRSPGAEGCRRDLDEAVNHGDESISSLSTC